MKFNISLLSVVILSLGLSTGCSKGGSGTTYYMKANIGNNPYSAFSCIARPQGSALLIEGLGTSSALPIYPYVSIVLANWHDGLDSIKVDSTQRNSYVKYFTTPTQYQLSFSGVVVINSINSENMSGLFQFMCTDSTQVTGGAFVAKRMQ